MSAKRPEAENELLQPSAWPEALLLAADDPRQQAEPLVVPELSRDRRKACPPYRRLAIWSSYEGTNWSGWQRQENAPSVQACLEAALSRICQEPITLHACSRTDAGVHARCHIAHFDTTCRIPAERLPLALGAFLPPSISVLASWEVAADFHARFDTVEKTYSYQIWNSRQRSPFLSRYSYRFFQGDYLDVEAMQEAAQKLKGQHDFSSFRAAGSETKGSIRELYKLQVERQDLGALQGEGLEGQMLVVTVTGSGFLYNMMRIIAGTLLEVGQHQRSPEEVEALLYARDRSQAGVTLPAFGLCLEAVRYRRPRIKADTEG